MTPRTSEETMKLLVSESSMAYKMLSGGADKTRAKWFQCGGCSFVAMFKKRPGE